MENDLKQTGASVTGIVVNFHTANLLPLLIEQLFKVPHIIEVVLVDNSGELHTFDAFPKEPPIRIIVNEKNRGFGAAVNQAVAIARGQWVLVVNPDCRLTDGAVERMLSVARGFNVPIVGPRFYWDEGKSMRLPPATGSSFWFDLACQMAAKSAMDAELLSFYWTMRHDRFWDAKEPFFEPFLSGACLLLEKRWIDLMGGSLFDERFFLYYEDADLCVRAMKNGFKPLCVPEAEVIHYWDQARSEDVNKLDQMMRAQSLFHEKYYGKVNITLPGARPLPQCWRDLGDIDRPPQFSIPGGVNGESARFFEVAVNPYFVPFAQAIIWDEKFEFPIDVWDRLGRGRYYGRIRDRFVGDLGVWTWTRS